MRTRTLCIAVATLVVLSAAGYGLYRAGVSHGKTLAELASVPSSNQVATAAADRRILYWHDPMVPGHKFDKPGKSPFMDMQLVPVYADEDDDGNTVRISPRMQQNLGMRTAEVTFGTLTQRIEVAGRAPTKKSLLIPSEALIRTGTRNIVIVSEGSGYFHPQQVQIGLESGEHTEILAGVSDGERVVTSGQFLIDSEASMKGIMSRPSTGYKP
jgi:hypothetical protein